MFDVELFPSFRVIAFVSFSIVVQGMEGEGKW